jgi:putative membrane protein
VNARLALVDALLSLSAILLLLLGRRAIRAGRIARHRALMLGATAASAAFLLVFVIRFARYGFQPYHHGGALRALYSVIFFTHEPLAVVNVPLGIAAVILGLLRRDAAHREVARYAYPIWLFVATTGVIIYGFLYVT